MKKHLIAFLLATFLVSLPVFANSPIAERLGEGAQASGANTITPIFAQFRRRRIRRRVYRPYVIRRRYYRPRYRIYRRPIYRRRYRRLR